MIENQRKFRNLFAIMAVVILMMAALAVSVFAESYSSLLGDANGDGVVNGKDATRIRKYISATDPASVDITSYADLNSDGVVNDADLAIILDNLAWGRYSGTVYEPGYHVIDGYVYYADQNGQLIRDCDFDGHHFDADGKLVGTDIFIVSKGNTYYVKNKVIVYNYQIINGNIYYFDNNGIMIFDCDHDGHHFGTDGKLVGNNIFITITGNTYYIKNNVIVYNYQVINGNVYYFDNDGIMIFDCYHDGYYFDDHGKYHGDNIFINISGNTYYIENNVIVYNYQVINGNVYYFDNDGIMIFDCYHDGYYFDDHGKYHGDNIFINISGNIYYIENNVIVYNYQVINGNVYYFDNDGIMIFDCYHDGYYFDDNGYLSDNYIIITIGGYKYYVIEKIAYPLENVYGYVSESDDDMDVTNNVAISDVECTATFGSYTFTTTSNDDGEFVFENIPTKNVTFTFSAYGYIDASLYVEDVEDAYLVIVLDKEVSNTLTGRVTIADADMDNSNNSPLAGATLSLIKNTSTNTYTRTATTDSNGYYMFEELTAGVYTLKVSCEGYITVTQRVQVKFNETNISNIVIEAIEEPEEDVTGYASGYVTDARTGLKITGITVYIREGLNNTYGEVLCTKKSASDGSYITDALAPGNYTAQFVDERALSNEDERYGTVKIAVKVLADKTIYNQNAVMSNNVGLDTDSMRIVLKWGSTPRDLDSHLISWQDDGDEYHVAYYSKNSYDGSANLDVDDTSSYGPETVTIYSFEDGIYRYFVHNYSGNSYYGISNSGATIDVYLENSATPLYSFSAPYGSGYYWHVFDYDYTTKEFIVVNQITNSDVQYYSSSLATEIEMPLKDYELEALENADVEEDTFVEVAVAEETIAEETVVEDTISEDVVAEETEIAEIQEIDAEQAEEAEEIESQVTVTDENESEEAVEAEAETEVIEKNDSAADEEMAEQGAAEEADESDAEIEICEE